ncbi:MAG: VCBS repeat-containing protein, partial [Verrucomicrobiota bacterium]
MKTPLALALPLVAATLVVAAGAPRDVSFQKIVLTGEYFCDGINAADVDGDGKMDAIAGPYWYAGPDFKTRHSFYEPVPQPIEEKPTNSMFTFPYDFNGDGKVDILVLGRVLFHEAYWYENPGKAEATKPDARWEKHFVSQRVFGEA